MEYEYTSINVYQLDLLKTLNDYGKNGYRVVSITDDINAPNWKTVLLERIKREDKPTKQQLLNE